MVTANRSPGIWDFPPITTRCHLPLNLTFSACFVSFAKNLDIYEIACYIGERTIHARDRVPILRKPAIALL
jgi:hypothetical protein